MWRDFPTISPTTDDRCSQSFSWVGQTGNGIEQRRKLKGERFKRAQVVSDPGQDDGPLEGGDDHDCETVGALEGQTCLLS